MHLPEQFNRVLAIGNAKGGVLKTTIAANIAALIARPDYRVLAIDLDGQGNLGLDLGYRGDELDDNGEKLAEALTGVAPPNQINIIKNVRPGLDVIPGGPYLHRSAPTLAGLPEAHLALQRILDPIVDEYELVILDLPPGDRGTRVAAFGATKWVVAPTKSDIASVEGVAEIMTTIDELRDHGNKYNEDIDLLAVVHVDSAANATQIKRATRRKVLEVLGLEEEPDIMLTTVVRRLEKVAQTARERGITFDELARKAGDAPHFWEILRGTAKAEDAIPGTASAGAEDMRSVAKEIIARITEAEAGDNQ